MSTTFKLALGAAAVVAVVLAGAFVLGPPAPTMASAGCPDALAIAHRQSLTVSIGAVTSIDTRPGRPTRPAGTDSPSAIRRIGPKTPPRRAWTWDDASQYVNAGQENFHSAEGTSGSAWSVTLAPGTTLETWADSSGVGRGLLPEGRRTPCAGNHDRLVPLCNEKRDCHPACWSARQDVQAFFTGGNFGDKMIVVAVWWGDSAPAVAPDAAAPASARSVPLDDGCDIACQRCFPESTTPPPPSGDRALAQSGNASGPRSAELAGLAGGVLGRQPRIRVAVVLQGGRLPS